MALDKAIIEERSKAFTPLYAEFVCGDFAKVAAKINAETHKLNEEQQEKLEDRILLYLLLWINEAQLAQSIEADCNLNQETTLDIVKDVLGAIPENILGSIRKTRSEISKGTDEKNTPRDDVETPKVEIPPSPTPPTPTPAPIPAPKPTPVPAPVPQPRITVAPQQPPVPQGKTVTLKDEVGKTAEGKMVGLKKEPAESSISGMRTMRGDINRLRGTNQTPEKETGSKFTQPFKGK